MIEKERQGHQCFGPIVRMSVSETAPCWVQRRGSRMKHASWRGWGRVEVVDPSDTTQALVGLQKEQIAVSLCLMKQLQPAASAPSLSHISPAGVLAPSLFLWSQKETLHEWAHTAHLRIAQDCASAQPHPSVHVLLVLRVFPAPPRTDP